MILTKVGATIPCAANGWKVCAVGRRAGGGLGGNAARTTLLLLTAQLKQLAPTLSTEDSNTNTAIWDAMFHKQNKTAAGTASLW